MTKEALREALRREEKALREKEENPWEEEDRKTVASLLSSSLLRQADIVFAFVPLRSEVDITPILDAFPVALPLCGEDGRMDFLKVDDWRKETRKGARGIREPMDGDIVTPGESSVILVPGLAFTRRGERLGRGGGFYDRYLSRYPLLTSVGVCRSFRLMEDLPTGKTDRKVRAVIVAGAWAWAPSTSRKEPHSPVFPSTSPTRQD